MSSIGGSAVSEGVSLLSHNVSSSPSSLAVAPSLPPPPPSIHFQVSPLASVPVNGGSSNKRKQSKPKSLLAQNASAVDGAPPLKMIKTTNLGQAAVETGSASVTRESNFDNDVVEIKEELPIQANTPPLVSGTEQAAFPKDPNSNQFLEHFGDDFPNGYDVHPPDDANKKLGRHLVVQKPLGNDLDGLVLDLWEGNRSVVVWNVREYLASNLKATAMLTMEPMIDTHVDPSGRELKKHSAFMKMLSSVLYDASKEAAMACPVKCKSDPSSKNFFAVVFEDLFAFFPNLNDLHVRGFRCPEGTRSYSVKTFCRNIMQRSFGFFLDKMR